MSQEPISIVKTQTKETFGAKVRKIADQLNQETDLQIKATSRILGAAAQIANNHDRLIDEVVEMVEEDLTQQGSARQNVTYTIEQLKKQFKSLSEAKLHFSLKANSWQTLVDKLNNESSIQTPLPSNQFETSVMKRFDAIESEVRGMHTELKEILVLLKQLTQSKDFN